MKKILVAFDGSESSKTALEVAKEIGGKFESQLIIVTVMPLEGTMNVYQNVLYADEVKKAYANEAEERLLAAAEVLSDYPYIFCTKVLNGDAAKEILAFAESENVTLIVMGNRGHGLFSRTLLGSVSNKVINHSTISTLVVKADIEN